MIKKGISVVSDSIPAVLSERDETDRKFYEIAKYCHAILVFGNLVHYPLDLEIMSPADFCQKHL